MIKIKLQRRGSRNKAFYRVIAIDAKNKMTGEALEIVGYWQPSTGSKQIDKGKVTEWIKKGAKVTPHVEELLKEKGSASK